MAFTHTFSDGKNLRQKSLDDFITYCVNLWHETEGRLLWRTAYGSAASRRLVADKGGSLVVSTLKTIRKTTRQTIH